MYCARIILNHPPAAWSVEKLSSMKPVPGDKKVRSCCFKLFCMALEKCFSQSLSCVWLFATPWTTAHQASLSITNSWSLLILMSIESVMPSSHLILCNPLLLPSIFPSIRVFPMSQLFASGGQSIGVSASTSVLPMNIEDWLPLGWTGWVSLTWEVFKNI